MWLFAFNVQVSGERQETGGSIFFGQSSLVIQTEKSEGIWRTSGEWQLRDWGTGNVAGESNMQLDYNNMQFDKKISVSTEY